MQKRRRPVDVLPISLAPRGLSRVLAAGYVGVSVSLFDQMVADGRMPRPKQVNSRKIWDRLAIDRYFEELDTDDHGSKWDDVGAEPGVKDVPFRAATAEYKILDIPRTSEEWQERARQWKLQVVASPLGSRELIGLAGLHEYKSEKIKRTKGASIGTMERLEARGYVIPDGKPVSGKCIAYKITPAGETAWEALPLTTRQAVKYTTTRPFPHHCAMPSKAML